MKPFSHEYLNKLIVVSEDAYGEMKLETIPKDDLRKRLNHCEEEYTEEEFEELLKKL